MMKQTVLITGTNHGLGLSLTNVFLDNGFTVFAGVYQHRPLSQIQSIKDRANLFLVNMDVSDMQTIRDAAELIEGHTQALDVIINNAAILASDETHSVMKTVFDPQDYDAIQRVINVNAIGPLRVANVFAPFLLKGQTKLLVNISSEAGSIAGCDRNGWFGYCMSKAALNMAGALMQNELKKHGGQVFQIHPGWMQTYTHGDKNTEADYSPDFSAEHIFTLIRNVDRYRSPKPVYMDLFGKPVAW